MVTPELEAKLRERLVLVEVGDEEAWSRPLVSDVTRQVPLLQPSRLPPWEEICLKLSGNIGTFLELEDPSVVWPSPRPVVPRSVLTRSASKGQIGEGHSSIKSSTCEWNGVEDTTVCEPLGQTLVVHSSSDRHKAAEVEASSESTALSTPSADDGRKSDLRIAEDLAACAAPCISSSSDEEVSRAGGSDVVVTMAVDAVAAEGESDGHGGDSPEVVNDLEPPAPEDGCSLKERAVDPDWRYKSSASKAVVDITAGTENANRRPEDVFEHRPIEAAEASRSASDSNSTVSPPKQRRAGAFTQAAERAHRKQARRVGRLWLEHMQKVTGISNAR